MKNYIYSLLLIFSVIIISCRKEDIKPVTNTTLNSGARDALYSIMEEWYLWYKLMPGVNLKDYNDPYELLKAVRYTKDRWSFVSDYSDFVATFQGNFVGHGISVGLDESGKARIVMIYKNSPMYAKGVRRGWIIKTLNNADLAAVMRNGDSETYNNLFGPAEAGRINTFVFQTPSGKDSTIVTAKAGFQVNSVIMDTTYNLSSGKTGYMVFHEFIIPSSNELKTAFSYFKQENIKDLILDLRYNSGGLQDVATELASYISGLPATKIFIKSDHNDKKQSENEITYFKPLTNSLALKRLVVICTRETASASEEVINGLLPYINVVCIGDTTNGKPTGMSIWQYNTTFIFAPVTIQLVNSAGQGDFYDGFPPAKYVPDDITHDFGDVNEYCLKEAIHYVETGSVSAKSTYQYQRQVHYSEKPRLMNNMYNIDPQILKDNSGY